MAQELSDVQLLGCPEPLEEMFIHRGQQDLISTHAGKVFLYFDLEGKGFSIFNDKRPGLLLYISIKSWSLSVIRTGRLHFLSAGVLDTCTD